MLQKTGGSRWKKGRTVEQKMVNYHEAHSFGQSTSNQRIEGWWSFYRRNRSTWWINLFKNFCWALVRKWNRYGTFVVLFFKLTQKDVDMVKQHWNTHYIRKSRHDTVSGRPDELFFIPESHGGIDGRTASPCSFEADRLCCRQFTVICGKWIFTKIIWYIFVMG